MLWDIFCKVIDNHGDVGVCWRLSSQLARRGENVRLWLDDARALPWMAPDGQHGVEVCAWETADGTVPGDVVVEAFGCELPAGFQAGMAAKASATSVQPAWINLEYLTAETYAERSHGLQSPVFTGPAAGISKRFFYPGFSPRTGGLLRDDDLIRRQAGFDRAAWLSEQRIAVAKDELLVSMFCYEPAALDSFLEHCAAGPQRTHLLVTAGRAAEAVRAALSRKNASLPSRNKASHLSLSWLPLLNQRDFDHLLWSCDLNFVRGEDSLVRALWAGTPSIWHIYPQHDNAHHDKLNAFLDWMDAPSSLRQFHHGWNGLATELPRLDVQEWTPCAEVARERLLAQDDLVTQLMRFARPAAGDAV